MLVLLFASTGLLHLYRTKTIEGSKNRGILCFWSNNNVKQQTPALPNRWSPITKGQCLQGRVLYTECVSLNINSNTDPAKLMSSKGDRQNFNPGKLFDKFKKYFKFTKIETRK